MQDKRAIQVGIIMLITLAVVLVLYFTSSPSKDNFRPAPPKTSTPQPAPSVEQRPAATAINRSWPVAVAALARRAMSYEVLSSRLVTDSGREQLKVVITSSYANRYEQYLGTAIKVARTMAINRNAMVVHVLLEPNRFLAGKGYQLADVTYYSDAMGDDGQRFDGIYWKAEAVQVPYSPQQLQVAKLWYQHLADHLSHDGKPDEAALKQLIAEQLHIPLVAVKLPQPKREPLFLDNQPSA
ncbi:hypothetical protein [Shewanella sp. YIC-542]|uniref:DUF4875 domain-containing protein n=1 Tax=Shewanella mytili TaxID=3377111 RepID=UPI00398E55CA